MAVAKTKKRVRRDETIKPASKKPKSTVVVKQKSRPDRRRRLYLPVYKLLRIKRVQHPVRLPSVWQLTKLSCQVLWRDRLQFLWLGAIYIILNIIFVRGLNAGADISTLKGQVTQALHGSAGQLASGTASFTGLLASSGNGDNTTAGVYQIVLGLIMSLATIWALRQASAKEKVGYRDPFYKGMTPLVPFVLVVLVILLQLVPFAIGATLYTNAINYGIAVGGIEKALWAVLFIFLTCISLYLVCSSIFALYIVTLPDMTPLKALRSARKLVNYRRFVVLRKLAFLPIALLVVATILMVPFILISVDVAQWAFFAVGMVSLILAHAYLYTLYRELLV